MRILVVDDDKNFRHSLVLYLNSNGWKVDEAADGLEGWLKLKNNSYDAVITDIEMPGMDGFALGKRARQQKLETKFIYMSAYPSSSTKPESTPLLMKPFVLEKLHSLLEKIVFEPNIKSLGDFMS
jgi:two-component system response regulator ArlR